MKSVRLKPTFLVSTLVVLAHAPRLTNPLSFHITSFEPSPSTAELDLSGDAAISASGSALQLNRGATNSSGSAFYRIEMQAWKVKGSTTHIADFTTLFRFDVSSTSAGSFVGDGAISFLMLPPTSVSYGTAGKENEMVAVEFDLVLGPRPDRFGIDVSSTKARTYVDVNGGGGVGGFVSQGVAQVRVDYDSKAKNLSATLGFSGSLDSYHVSYLVDLSVVLPKKVHVGFTASTGTSGYVEIHRVLSWSFTSSLHEVEKAEETKPGSSKTGMGTVAGAAAAVVLALASGVYFWMKRSQSPPCTIHINNSNCCCSRSYCCN